MRQRRVKNIDKRLEDFNDLLIWNPSGIKGKWREYLENGKYSKLYVEIGCGKGDFVKGMAEKYPDVFFVAVEANRSVIWKALRKVREASTENVKFVPFAVEDLRYWFGAGEIDKIYLNFSDPWPKNDTAHRRLTHRNRLRQYFEILPRGGELVFKTDNEDLFEFTIQEARAQDLIIADITRDLHNSHQNADNIETEYEKKWSDRGKNINMLKLVAKDGRKEDKDMEKKIMSAYNGREIPKEDKNFGCSSRANKAIAEHGKDAVINATIGTLLDDETNLIVLSSVDEVVKSLEPDEYAAYAPIAGIPGFKEAIKKATFCDYEPLGITGVVATPGGTGSIRNVISNYSSPGDKVLTHDWYWTPYKSIASEQGRGFETFEMFDDEGNLNIADFEYKVKKLTRMQEHLVIILNTPANNPTGYSFSDDDWANIVEVLNAVPENKKIALLLDVAYIDFAGDEAETRTFLPIIETLNENILPIFAYSASKTFTFYGFRCAAMICLSKNQDIVDDFETVCAFSARATWSNSPRAPQEVVSKIYSDERLLAKVSEERKIYRDMLLARGRAFESAALKCGLEIVPFRGGFFASVPCDNPDEVSAKLEEKLVFCIPMSKGIRVSIASISEEKCAKLPAIIKETIDEVVQ